MAMTQLVIEDFEGTRTVVPLDMDALTIGRGAGHLIQLTEQNVSRDHAKFYLVDEGWVVEDLGSFNGVQVNNVKVQGPVMLREGDIITIGDYVMQLAGDASRDTVELVGAGIATDPYEGRAAEGAAGAPATGEAPVAPAGGASGPHGAVPAPASVEGITPAAGNIADAKPSIDDGLDEFEFDDDSSTGKKIFVVMSVIAIGATLFYAFGKSDEKSSPPKKTAVADNVDAKAEVPADDPDEEEVGAAAASTTAAEEPERGETGDTTQAETGTTGEEDAADAEEPEPVEA
ncbi:MAG: FHA domain-containing protein, partial [Nannocystaceae bacterium]